MSRKSVRSRSTHDLTVTASLGAACYPDTRPSLDNLLRDVALYATEDAGRHRVQAVVNNLGTL